MKKFKMDTSELFRSVISHEIKTPLTVLYGYLQLLVADSKNLNTSQVKWVRESYQETLKISEMIEEILTLHEVTNGKLSLYLEEIPLQFLLNSSIKKVKQIYPDLNVNINLKQDQRIFVDKRRFSRVLTSLLLISARDNKKLAIDVVTDNHSCLIKLANKDVNNNRNLLALEIIKAIVVAHKGKVSFVENQIILQLSVN